MNKILTCKCCGKTLTIKQVWKKNSYCSIECAKKERKIKGWFYKKPMFYKSKRGCVGRALSKNTIRQEYESGEDAGNKSIGWFGIYNKKQFEQMKKEKQLGVEK